MTTWIVHTRKILKHFPRRSTANSEWTHQASLLSAIQRQPSPANTGHTASLFAAGPSPQSTVQCLWPRTIKELKLPIFDMHSQHSAQASHSSSPAGDESSGSTAGNQLSTIVFEVRTGPCVQGRVGQDRIYTPYMTVYLVNFLPKIPYIHRIYMVLANSI
jgi:hypothetical protein